MPSSGETFWRMYQQGWRPAVDTFPGVRLGDSWFRIAREDLRYAHVVTDKARMYADPNNASKPSRTLWPGFVYVTYTVTQRFGNRTWALVDEERGYWMDINDLEMAVPSTFRGFYFPEPPTRPFGWILIQGLRPRTGPGLDHPALPFGLDRYQRVDVFEKVGEGDEAWYRIGPDMWVPESAIAVVEPRTQAPPEVPADRWIEVNLYQQTLMVYEDNRLVYATLISSGEGVFYTRVGVFQIYEKIELETMRGAFTVDRSDFYYLEDVPWTMYYDEARAIHGTYWHDQFGTPTSRGCVNLSIVDANWVFQWAEVGDWVYVWDPSGRTPAE